MQPSTDIRTLGGRLYSDPATGKRGPGGANEHRIYLQANKLRDNDLPTRTQTRPRVNFFVASWTKDWCLVPGGEWDRLDMGERGRYPHFLFFRSLGDNKMTFSRSLGTGGQGGRARSCSTANRFHMGRSLVLVAAVAAGAGVGAGGYGGPSPGAGRFGLYPAHDHRVGSDPQFRPGVRLGSIELRLGRNRWPIHKPHDQWQERGLVHGRVPLRVSRVQQREHADQRSDNLHQYRGRIHDTRVSASGAGTWSMPPAPT